MRQASVSIVTAGSIGVNVTVSPAPGRREPLSTHHWERCQPVTANNRHRGLQAFFTWLVAEGEVKESLIETSATTYLGCALVCTD